MTTQNYIVLTAAQKATAEGMDGPPAEIEPRAIDNASPGVGINLNPDATGMAAGAVVTLAGNYVAPKRIVDDVAYLTNWPDLVTFLLTLPFCLLENETIFAPVDDY